MTGSEYPARRLRLLFVVNDARFFLSHRMPVAAAAQAAGYDVVVACPASSHVDEIERGGARVRITANFRGSHSVVSTLRLLVSLFSILRRERPDLVHLITSKPIILGGIIARGLGLPVVAAISGLGFIFTQSGLRAAIVRKLVLLGYRVALRRRGATVIFQNPDDQALFRSSGVLDRGEDVLIHGSGADLHLLTRSPEPLGRVRVILPARMLRDKGVFEFAEAAKRLEQRGVDADFHLLGDLDQDNPSALTADDIRAMERTSNVTWRPHTNDIAGALASAHIVAFPSYREGLPKSIVDAAACGRPVVTTDVSGCRDAVVENVTGLLVRVKDSSDLADKLETLIGNAVLREHMGTAARAFAEERFDVRNISAKHLELYKRLLLSSTAASGRQRHRRALLSLLAAGSTGFVGVAIAARCGAKSSAASRAGPDTGPIDVTTLRGQDPDDTLAFQRAIASGRPVYVPAGRGSGPAGVYRVNRLGVKSGTTIYGDGPKTVIQTAFTDTVNLFYCDSGSTNQTIDDIYLHDFTIEGDVVKSHFREHFNLLHFAGVRRLRLVRLMLRGFRGDAIYVGAENIEGDTRSLRKNKDVLIQDCTIDGIIRNNRNGISISGGENIVIRGCRFFRCSRGDMPGPIDFEPDGYGFYYLRNVEVSDCSFIDCGGAVGQIAIEFPAEVLAAPENIVIRNNRFVGCKGSAADVSVRVARMAQGQPRKMKILILGNRGKQGFAPFRVWSAENVVLSDNEWHDYPDCARVGADAPAPACRDITLRSKFVRCGSNKSSGVEVSAAIELVITGAQFEDCGDGSAQSSAIEFSGSRPLNAVVSENVFTSTKGRMKRAWRVTGVADAGAPVVRSSQNRLLGVSF